MFRIRRVFDDVLPVDRKAVTQVQQILRAQFPTIRDVEVAELPAKLRDPLKYALRYLLFVADDIRGDVRGFALIAHAPDLKFCFLEYIATGKQLSGGGVGGALYERVREESRALNVVGLFFECAPDDLSECATAQEHRASVARLSFYESYGARPVANTLYSTPIRADDNGFPHLVFDDFGRGVRPRRELARKIVRAILERKYGYLCPPDYVQRVVESFRDDPMQLREFRYAKPEVVSAQPPAAKAHRIVLVVNDKHHIHHVRERGYVEAPVRIGVILREIEPTGLFRKIEPKEFPESHILAVHDGRFLDFLKKVCQSVPPGKSVYPYVFPIRNATRPPKEIALSAGYYCIDTFTPLNHNAYLAAKRAADCTLTAAEAIVKGERLGYALVRPPGHHAERRAFGGFCYFNNVAIAAHYLSNFGRVAVLDVDYHHGNGQQVIFYERADVLTVSIHGHPQFAYPYFTGFADERGAGFGEGANLNIPMPESVNGAQYRVALERAITRIRRFRPAFLAIALGLDTAKGDPTGSWTLTSRDFEMNGRTLGRLRLPTLVVQEGGYRTRTLGTNARAFFTGLAEGAFGWHDVPRERNGRSEPKRAPDPAETPT